MKQRRYAYSANILAIMVSMLAITSCASPKKTSFIEPAITKTELLSGDALFDLNATDMTLPDAGVMELNQKMRDYLDQNISRKASKAQKLNALLSLTFSKGNLGVTYDRSQTLTAQGTFISGRGNCLGVSYLFSSMAREIGLTTYFRNVDIPPAWSMEEGIIYRYRHVNVEVALPHYKAIIVDSDEVNNVPTYEANRISTQNAVAQYYSNKGAAYLQKNDRLNAFLYFKKAITTDPSQAELWSNLGVLYSKEEEHAYAESAYQTALNLQDDNLSTLNNMASLYDKMEKFDLRDKYRALAARENNKNPYFHFIEAQKAYNTGDYPDSLFHTEQAIKYEANEPKFYVLLSQIYQKTDQPDKAADATLKGKEAENRIQRAIDNQDFRIKFRTRKWQVPNRRNRY